MAKADFGDHLVIEKMKASFANFEKRFGGKVSQFSV
jgi:hypothetical protein